MFRNLIRAALLAAFALAGVAPSFALYTDPAVINGQKIIPARSCAPAQNVCYLRATINFNDNSIGNGVWAFTLPANAYVLTVDLDVTTAFNATTTNNLTIGATATGTDFLASTSITSAGIQHMTTAAGLGVAATGNTSLQTRLNSAVPVFFRYTQSGTAASTGVVTVIITYGENDDK
jgi:hypothetical protein